MDSRQETDEGVPPSTGSVIQILMCVFAACIYGGGVYLHLKIIQVSRREKEMSWMLDVTNSIIFILHFAHAMIMHSVTYLVKDLYLYLGKWYCYLSKAVTMMGNAHTTQNSFIIALMKYMMIVHFQTPSDRRKLQIKYAFVILNMVYPVFVIGFFFLLIPDFIIRFDGISQANRCLGKPELKINGTFNDNVKIANACIIIIAPAQNISFQYILYLIRKSSCWLHVVITYANVGNFLEMILYCRIFAFMHRYGNHNIVIDRIQIYKLFSLLYI